jgi:hypothetical protein
MAVYVNPYGTPAQKARGAAIGAKSVTHSMGGNSVQSLITGSAANRVSPTGTNRRQVQSSRRLAGMPSYMTLPKSAMASSGPSMIRDSAQSGK